MVDVCWTSCTRNYNVVAFWNPHVYGSSSTKSDVSNFISIHRCYDPILMGLKYSSYVIIGYRRFYNAESDEEEDLAEAARAVEDAEDREGRHATPQRMYSKLF